MHGRIDNVLTKQQWCEALSSPADQWSVVGEGQQWLHQMLSQNTPELADEHAFNNVSDFLHMLDELACSGARHNSQALYTDWLRDPSGRAIEMAYDLSYTCGRIGGPDLGVAIGAHTLGGWYQLRARVDDFLRVCYLPLYPYVMENDFATTKFQLGDAHISINLLFAGLTHVVIDRNTDDAAKTAHICVNGGGYAEAVEQLRLTYVEASTLAAALGVLDEAIDAMRIIPNDPDSLRGLLRKGQLYINGVLTHA